MLPLNSSHHHPRPRELLLSPLRMSCIRLQPRSSFIREPQQSRSRARAIPVLQQRDRAIRLDRISPRTTQGPNIANFKQFRHVRQYLDVRGTQRAWHALMDKAVVIQRDVVLESRLVRIVSLLQQAQAAVSLGCGYECQRPSDCAEHHRSYGSSIEL